MTTKNRITIVHGLPDTNTGGAALGIALVNVLKKNFPNTDLAYISSHVKEEIIQEAYPFILEEHPDLKILPYPVIARADNYLMSSSLLRKLRNLLWVGGTMASIVTLLLPFLGRRNKTMNHIRNSSVVISRGTQIFYDKKGLVLISLLSKFWLCIPLLYAWRVNVPFIIYAQTIGPIHSPWVRRLMKFVLNRATLVLPREQYSYNYLRDELKIPADKIIVVPDSVFGLASPPESDVADICNKYDLPRGRYGCLVVRHYMEKNSETKSSGLYEQFAFVASHLIDQDICDKIVIATQCHHLPNYRGFECDSKISQELYSRLQNDLDDKVVLIDEPLSPHDAMCIYGGARYLLSVRLHAAIFSMISGTPAIAVSYWGSKTRGIFQMLGFDDAFVEKEEMTKSGLVDRLLKIEQDYDGYCADMSEKVERAYIRAQATPQVFADLIPHF